MEKSPPDAETLFCYLQECRENRIPEYRQAAERWRNPVNRIPAGTALTRLLKRPETRRKPQACRCLPVRGLRPFLSTVRGHFENPQWEVKE